MEKFTLEIEAKLDKATKGVENLTSEIVDLKKAQEAQVKGLQDQVKNLEKQNAKTAKATKSLAKGFKGVGLAMKTAGIGLFLALFNKLGEAMMKNQQVADTVETVFTAIGMVFKEVSDRLMSVYESVSQATGGFDALKKVLGGAFSIAINTIVLSIQAIVLGVQKAQLAWEDSFLGGKDPEKIKELQANIDATSEKIDNTTQRIKDAGSDIANNFVEAVGEFGTLAEAVATETANAIEDINIETIASNAKTLVESKKNYALLEAQSRRLIEQYDLEAEQQRQIRDDVSLSVEERIAANEKLGEVLKEQSEEEKKAIQNRIDALNKQIELEGESHELTAQLYDLNTEMLAIDAKVAGFKSEQLTNETALKQELVDLDKTRLQSASELAIGEANFLAESELNVLKQIELKRSALEKEKEVELERLQFNIDNAKEGTQARVDAEAEYLKRKQEFSQAGQAIDREEAEAKKQNLAAVGNALGNLSSVLGEETAAGKATAIAATTISTYQSAQDSYKSLAGIPIIGPALGFAAAAAAIAGGVAQIKKITATKIPKASDKPAPPSPSLASASAPVAGSVAPAFNVVGQGGSSQLAEAIGGQSQEPVRAYVVSNDVTSAQSLDRNIIETTSL